LSCPEIAIHKKYPNGKHEDTLCEANSKDYSMSFKLQIVQEIERGQLTVTEAKIWYSK
jgi:transposase-like protein